METARLNTTPERLEESSVPLFVDLDGTLIRTDLLQETALSQVRSNPWRLLLALASLFDRPRLKRLLAADHQVDVKRLPYNQEVVSYVTAERAKGRRIVLATAASSVIANEVAEHLQIFDAVVATESENMKGARKLRAIEAIAAGPFDYIGDARADVPIWRAARRAVVVGSKRLATSIDRPQANVQLLFESAWRWRDLLRALRPHQWAKNALVFVPLLTAFLFLAPDAWARSALAFVAFSVLASGTYIWNDLLDLSSDRQHATKRGRPFASGALPIWIGIIAAPLLVLTGAAIGLAISGMLFWVLAAYVMLTVAYSVVIKTYMLADVLALAALYTIRIIGGAVALEEPVSMWLLAFSFFLFLSLALVKRCTEIRDAVELSSQVVGRGYRTDDLPVLWSMGAASAVGAVVVMALFINDQATIEKYRTPELLWFICPCLLYWVGRIWIKTARGEMHDDPVVFALKDRASKILLVVIASLTMAAAFGPPLFSSN